MVVINIRVVGPKVSGEEKILTPEALEFVGMLHREFNWIREDLLDRRKQVLHDIRHGKLPNFCKDTFRGDTWKVAPAPEDLKDRRVEITGPASSRKMVINALNSGASCYMADAEDSESPTWANIINGQINLFDAIRRQIDFETGGKKYQLDEKTAVLFFRPRGWHLLEKHVLVDGEPILASLFDFGMYFYHNARALIGRGTGVYLYLPKIESYCEAALWDSAFHFSEKHRSVLHGTIRATVLIETILAAFEMDEILYALREHSAGLNCGRWDYIFSFIKKLSHDPRFVLPDRSSLTMDGGFLAPYCDLLVQTCHKRGAHAMGGMAAQSPSKEDQKVNEENELKIKADTAREVKLGFDGKWVSHPAYVPVAKEIFNLGMPGPNQLLVLREDVRVTEEDLLSIPPGDRTITGLHRNIRVCIQYLEDWLRGVGCVQLNNLMEDAATAEISRAQVWQWRKHHVLLAHGHKMTNELLNNAIAEEISKLTDGQFGLAEKLFREMVFAEEFPEFLTLAAYDQLVVSGN